MKRFLYFVILVFALVFTSCTTRTAYTVDFVSGNDTVSHTFAKTELTFLHEDVHPVIYHHRYGRLEYYKLCIKSDGVQACIAYSSEPINVLSITSVTK